MIRPEKSSIWLSQEADIGLTLRLVASGFVESRSFTVRYAVISRLMP